MQEQFQVYIPDQIISRNGDEVFPVSDLTFPNAALYTPPQEGSSAEIFIPETIIIADPIIEKNWSELSGLIRYLPKEEQARVQRAYAFALVSHDQYALTEKKRIRKDKKTHFVCHPGTVAMYLVTEFGIQPDADTLIAALLHDVPEDTTVKTPTIRAYFGHSIATTVESLTKIKSSELRDLEEAGSLLKIYKSLMNNETLRVILIKLADNLHNSRTIEYLPDNQRSSYARRTLEIFSPLADRLGLFSVADALDRAAYKALFELEGSINKYGEIEALVQERQKELRTAEVLEQAQMILDQNWSKAVRFQEPRFKDFIKEIANNGRKEFGIQENPPIEMAVAYKDENEEERESCFIKAQKHFAKYRGVNNLSAIKGYDPFDFDKFALPHGDYHVTVRPLDSFLRFFTTAADYFDNSKSTAARTDIGKQLDRKLVRVRDLISGYQREEIDPVEFVSELKESVKSHIITVHVHCEGAEPWSTPISDIASVYDVLYKYDPRLLLSNPSVKTNSNGNELVHNMIITLPPSYDQDQPHLNAELFHRLRLAESINFYRDAIYRFLSETGNDDNEMVKELVSKLKDKGLSILRDACSVSKLDEHFLAFRNAWNRMHDPDDSISFEDFKYRCGLRKIAEGDIASFVDMIQNFKQQYVIQSSIVIPTSEDREGIIAYFTSLIKEKRINMVNMKAVHNLEGDTMKVNYAYELPDNDKFDPEKFNQQIALAVLAFITGPTAQPSPQTHPSV